MGPSKEKLRDESWKGEKKVGEEKKTSPSGCWDRTGGLRALKTSRSTVLPYWQRANLLPRMASLSFEMTSEHAQCAEKITTVEYGRIFHGLPMGK